MKLPRFRPAVWITYDPPLYRVTGAGTPTPLPIGGRAFSTYRDARAYARQKATKFGAIFDETPEASRAQ